MQFQNYRVQIGDTLEKLALRFYGSRDKVGELAALNKLSPPFMLSIGQTLVIPLEDAITATATDAGTAADDLQEIVVTAKRERLPAWVWLALALAAAWALTDRRRLF
jgi:LysM repeat protein